MDQLLKNLPVFPRCILLADWTASIQESVFLNMQILLSGKGLRLPVLNKIVLILPMEDKFELQTWGFTPEPTKESSETYPREKIEEFLAKATEDELLISLTRPVFTTPPHLRPARE